MLGVCGETDLYSWSIYIGGGFIGEKTLDLSNSDTYSSGEGHISQTFRWVKGDRILYENSNDADAHIAVADAGGEQLREEQGWCRGCSDP